MTCPATRPALVQHPGHDGPHTHTCDGPDDHEGNGDHHCPGCDQWWRDLR